MGHSKVAGMTSEVRRGLNVLLYYLSGLVPRSQSRVAFGAWQGHRYADNPRYLYEYLLERRLDLRLIWCGRPAVRGFVPVGANARFVPRMSISCIWQLLRAKTIFVSHGYDDLFPFNLTFKADLIYLGHGLAIKNMGSPARPGGDEAFSGLLRRIKQAPVGHSHYVASSPEHKQKLLMEYSTQNCRPDNTLILGQPRCDVFTQENSQTIESTRKFYEQKYEIPADKRLVTYLPTFRDTTNDVFSFRDLPEDQVQRLQSILDRHEAVLVERSHFVDGVLRSSQRGENDTSVVDLSAARDVDSIDLLLASDLLITDYSGAYVDYLLLDRPVLHFVYDYDDYLKADRGLYFDLKEVAGGPLLGSADELIDALEEHLSDTELGAERRARVRSRLLANETGRSREAIAGHWFPTPSRDRNA